MMLVEDRHNEIIELLERHTMLGIQELCDTLHVSAATMRRDLTRMQELGLIKRMHGGAILTKPDDDSSAIIQSTETDKMLKYKQAIAEKAITMIKPGDTIFIDAGSTTELLATRFVDVQPISIITNSITIAHHMYTIRNGSSIFVCGGTLSEVSPEASIVGPLAEQMISQFRSNICFIGTSAIDIKQGLTDQHLLLARIKEKMITHSSKVVLVTDHSKFGKVKQAFICPLTQIDCIITDDQAPAEEVQQLRNMGIEVILARVALEE
jgi:DeoR/GlpR family transcriptional regulator of sugar metabolism